MRTKIVTQKWRLLLLIQPSCSRPSPGACRGPYLPPWAGPGGPGAGWRPPGLKAGQIFIKVKIQRINSKAHFWKTYPHQMEIICASQPFHYGQPMFAEILKARAEWKIKHIAHKYKSQILLQQAEETKVRVLIPPLAPVSCFPGRVPLPFWANLLICKAAEWHHMVF